MARDLLNEYDFANHYAAPVTERTIERGHDAGLPTALGAGPVSGGRQYRSAGIPSIGAVRRIALVTSR